MQAETALAVWVMVTEHAGRNCAGGLGYGAGLGYSNRICNAFICPQKRKDMLSSSRSLLRCVGVLMSGCVCWHAQLATGLDSFRSK